MAKKQEEEREVFVPPRHVDYELSATSEYYLYGRGNAKDYARAVNGIREEVRRMAYGPQEVPPPAIKKKLNASALFVALFALIAIAAMVVGVWVDKLSFAGGRHVFAIWKMLVDKKTADSDLASIAVTASSIATAVGLLVTFVSALCKIKSLRTGGWLKFVSALTCLVTIWAPLALFLTKEHNGIGNANLGYWIVSALTVITALAALIKKDKITEE